MNIHRNNFFEFYRKHQDLINILITIFISILVFYNSLGSYFSEVDDLNLQLHSKRDLCKIFVTNTYGYNNGGNYRPLEPFSHQIDRYIWGDENFVGRHLTNLFIHILNVILVYLIALGLTKRSLIGLISALLFSVHIINGNSLVPVAWISGRTDILVTFFYLLAFLFFIKFFSNKNKFVFYFLSLIAFIGALLSKEMGITFPIIIVLYLILFSELKKEEENKKINIVFFPRLVLIAAIIAFVFSTIFTPFFVSNFISNDGILLQATIRKIKFYQLLSLSTGGLLFLVFILLNVSKKFHKIFIYLKYSIPYFALLFLYLIIRIEILGGIGGNYKLEHGQNVIFQIGIDSFMRDLYGLAGLFFPVGANYNISIFNFQINDTFLFFLTSIFFFILLLVLLIWLLKNKYKVATFFYLWIFISIIPVHNLIIASAQYQSRYLYLATVGFSIFVSILIYKLKQNKIISSRLTKPITALIILCVMMFNSFFIIKKNTDFMESGNIMKNFVTDMRKYQREISKAKSLYFITFPISKINSINSVFVSVMLDEPLNFIDGIKGYTKKYNYSILFYTQELENKNTNLTWIGNKNFILTGANYRKTFLIPQKLTLLGQQMGTIYKKKPHAQLNTFSYVGETQKTNSSIVKMIEINKNNNTAKYNVKIKKQVFNYGGPTLFFLYKDHHFELVKTVVAPF